MQLHSYPGGTLNSRGEAPHPQRPRRRRPESPSAPLFGVDHTSRRRPCQGPRHPYLAIAGGISEGIGALHVSGIDAVFTLCRGPMTLDKAQRNAEALLADAAEQAVHGFVAGR